MQGERITRREFVGAMVSAAVLSGCGSMLGPSEAMANTAYGSQISFAAGGKTYYGKAMVGNGDGSRATGYAIASASSAVGVGQIGALARLYDFNGRFKTSREAYNSASGTNLTVSTDAISTTSGTYYYANGILYGWNRSGYTAADIPRTPNVGRFLMPFVVDNYPVTSRGLAYGSLLSAEFVGEEPDLVSAVSESGVEGFVRLSDLNGPSPRTPEEAVALYGEESSKTIPLVDLDGNQLDVVILHYGGAACE